MCWWSIRVTVTVTGNLVLRVCGELVDAVCQLLVAWWGSSAAGAPAPKPPAAADLVAIQTRAWYQRTDRKGAEVLLTAAPGHDGRFLVRPSSRADNVCSLSVVQDGQVFHINVRRRPDEWLALGRAKQNEHCFGNIQDIVDFYKRETLLINSAGKQHLTVLMEPEIVTTTS